MNQQLRDIYLLFFLCLSDTFLNKDILYDLIRVTSVCVTVEVRHHLSNAVVKDSGASVCLAFAVLALPLGRWQNESHPDREMSRNKQSSLTKSLPKEQGKYLQNSVFHSTGKAPSVLVSQPAKGSKATQTVTHQSSQADGVRRWWSQCTHSYRGGRETGPS